MLKVFYVIRKFPTFTLSTKNEYKMTKAQKKILKAVYQVHTSVNTLNEHGLYDIEKGRRRAKSVHHWESKKTNLIK